MKTLLVAATIFELKGLLHYFNLPASNLIENETFDVLITGVGMTATAFALGRQLKPGKYNLVLNLGIAGSFNPDCKPGEVIHIIEDILSELGAEGENSFIPINELGFGESTFRPLSPERSLYPTLKTGRGITVNTVHGQQRSIDAVKTRLSPDVESMEGAAVIYACKQLNIPCIQVRSISNYVEIRNKANWNVPLAIENLNRWAIAFLTNN